MHMITTLYGYDTSVLITGDRCYLEGSEEMYGKFENGQHPKRGESLNQISG